MFILGKNKRAENLAMKSLEEKIRNAIDETVKKWIELELNHYEVLDTMTGLQRVINQQTATLLKKSNLASNKLLEILRENNIKVNVEEQPTNNIKTA